MSTGNRPVPAQEAAFAPGLRVEIRDAEWVIKRADLTSNGFHSLLVTGISELVRGKEARFLTEIDHVTPLHPEDTDLVPDTSPRFSHARLYLESLLRQSPPTDSNLWIGHKAAIDVMPFQLDPALQALGQIRHRILLADSVGLGKTIEVGVLLAELIRRGKGKRILVVTTKAMMTQFQKEMWARFTIPLARLDRAGIDRIRQDVPADANPFHYFDKTIISVDTLKQERDFRVHLEKSYWDIIVIDEAHNVAVRGSKSARAKLAELLGKRSDTMILASATPHGGRAESFASLMNMLNPTAIANPKSYGPKDIEGLYLRRFKKDVQEQIGKAILDRKTNRWPKPASGVEEQAFDLLTRAPFLSFDKAPKTGQLLFRTVLEKALFSSPAACAKTIKQRLNKIEKVQNPEAARDRETLQALVNAVDAIIPQHFSKYQNLLALLRNGGALDWHPERTDDRLVIFTERVETLKFLKERLAEDLKLKPGQIETLYGQDTDDKKLQDTVDRFGRDKEPVRLLIATDIAAEGLNLHFLAHKLIHFDIPWSLMVFQQRNGRVDRYGQEAQPIISYLCTESANPKIRGDQRILELLSEKDEQAQKNIGDPSAFQGVYDQALEEVKTGEAMEKALSANEYDKQLQQTAKAADLLSILRGSTPPPKTDIASAAVDRALGEHAIVATRDGYQPLGAAVMERTIATYLRGLLAGPPGPERNLFSVNLSSTIGEAIASFEDDAGLRLNAEQRRGVEVALHHPLSVLTGGAGTGKTTVLQVIHQIAERVAVPILQMALSGRAVQHLREATGRPASTIAAFLLAAERGSVHPESEPLVVIDESSMLDVPLMYRIIRTLPARARILLVGDPHQLPPIGFGLIFQVLAASSKIPKVELVEVHRQAQSSGIPQVAREIRHGIVPSLPAFAARSVGVSFIDAGDGGVMDHIVAILAGWRGCEDKQVLGVTKRGANGTRNINATLHAMTSAAKPKLEGWAFAEGDPIIYLVNDYRKELWNGSLGRIEKVLNSKGRQAILCSLDGARHEIPEEDFYHLDLAYTITVHKAQGSQFKRVIVPIVRTRLLDRTLIYTALTRGMEQVVFVGDRRAFNAAVTAPPHAHERQVGFSI